MLAIARKPYHSLLRVVT